MKRILSAFLACVLLVGCVFSLASCFGNINEKYAEKVNEAAKADEHYTYEQVLEDLGEDAADATMDLGAFLGGRSGMIVAVKGCKDLDEIEDKIDAGEDVKGIVVFIAGGKATSAKYGVINEDTFKEDK